jgi:hypothetical protein
VQLSADTNIVAWLPWPFGTKAALWPDKCKVVEEFTGSYGGGGGQKALVFDFTGGAFESAASASHMLPFGAHFAAAAVLRACVPKGNRNNFYLVVARFVAGGLRQYGASYTARLAAAARANSGLASEVSAAKLLRDLASLVREFVADDQKSLTARAAQTLAEDARDTGHDVFEEPDPLNLPEGFSSGDAQQQRLWPRGRQHWRQHSAPLNEGRAYEEVPPDRITAITFLNE